MNYRIIEEAKISNGHSGIELFDFTGRCESLRFSSEETFITEAIIKNKSLIAVFKLLRARHPHIRMSQVLSVFDRIKECGYVSNNITSRQQNWSYFTGPSKSARPILAANFINVLIALSSICLSIACYSKFDFHGLFQSSAGEFSLALVKLLLFA